MISANGNGASNGSFPQSRTNGLALTPPEKGRTVLITGALDLLPSAVAALVSALALAGLYRVTGNAAAPATAPGTPAVTPGSAWPCRSRSGRR